MVTKNIEGKYDVSGTNESVIYGLSSDTKPTDDTIANGYKFVEMDTKRTFLYDAESKVWRMWKNNNSGEDTGVGLNINGATVGQTIVVTSVDADGVPQAWTPVTLASVDGTKLVLP